MCKRFEVKGFPTIKYFKDGEFAFDAGDARESMNVFILSIEVERIVAGFDLTT